MIIKFKPEAEKKIIRIVKRAREKGFEMRENDITKAKPVKQICGVLKSRYPFTTEELLNR